MSLLNRSQSVGICGSLHQHPIDSEAPALPFVIPSGHGPGAPTQGDEKHLFFNNRSS